VDIKHPAVHQFILHRRLNSGNIVVFLSHWVTQNLISLLG